MPAKQYKQVALRPSTYAKLVEVAKAKRWKNGEAVDAIVDDYIQRHMTNTAAGEEANRSEGGNQ